MQPVKSSSAAVRVVVCDDHPVVRDALTTLLSTSAEYQIVGEAATAAEALELVRSLRPDILVTDITLPDKSGVEVLYQIRAQKLETLTVIFSMHEDDRTIAQIAGAGARGFIHKSSPARTILETLAKVREGKTSLPASAYTALEGGGTLSSIISAPDPLSTLSKREREIFYLLIEGLPNRTIAQKLFVSPRTIETHRARVIRKLGCCSTADLIRYAIRNHLSSP